MVYVLHGISNSHRLRNSTRRCKCADLALHIKDLNVELAFIGITVYGNLVSGEAEGFCQHNTGLVPAV